MTHLRITLKTISVNLGPECETESCRDVDFLLTGATRQIAVDMGFVLSPCTYLIV